MNLTIVLSRRFHAQHLRFIAVMSLMILKTAKINVKNIIL